MGKTFSLIRIGKIIEFCVLFKLDEDVDVDCWKVDFAFSLSSNLTEARVKNTVVTFILIGVEEVITHFILSAGFSLLIIFLDGFNLHFEDFCVLELAVNFVDEGCLLFKFDFFLLCLSSILVVLNDILFDLLDSLDIDNDS